MKFVKSALIVAACLLIAVCSSAAQNPVGVLVNTNGTLRFPTNLFAANSNLLNAAVAPSSGVGSATNALTTLNGLVGTNQTFSAGPAGNTDLAITSSGTNHAFNIAIRTNFAAITISNNVNRALLTPTGALIDVSCDGPSIIYHTLTQNTIFALIDPPASTAQERFIKVTVTGNGVNTVGFGFTGGTIVWMSTQLATPGNGSVVDYQFAIRGATAYASVCCPPINIEHVTGLQAALDDKQVEGDYITALTGDGTAIGPGSAAFTLANTAVTPGTFGSATKTVTATVDAKGRLTALSEQTATPAWASITSTPTTLGGYGITDAQPLDSDLTAIALLTTTAFGRGLLDDADATAGRVSLGVVIGTNVQAYDADLDDLADGSLTGSKVGTGINGDNVTSGTVSDARIASTIARDSEVAAAYQLAFTTGAGVTNQANVLSGNYNPGANITFTTNANGAVVITGSAGGGSGTAGTMINTGTPAVSQVPRYTDTTGTNAAPSLLTVDVSGNGSLPGVLRVDSVISTNGFTSLAAGGSAMNSLQVTNKITNAVLTASRLVVSGTDQALASSTATTTEAGYLSGVTSAIQTQLDSKLGTNQIFTSSITITIDGNGSPITTGIKGFIEIPYDCTIQSATMLADQSGSAVVDVWKDTYANYPPLVGDTITAAAKPTISAATKSQDTTLTGWTKSVTAGDVLVFNVDSASTITRLTLSLKVLRTTETVIGITIDGAGSTITTGVKGFLEMPYAGTISRVTMLADQTGSAVVDVWKDTYANYPPTVADTITASAKPTITAANKSQDATLTGWTTTFNAGDIIGFNVDSASSITRLTLTMKVTR